MKPRTRELSGLLTLSLFTAAAGCYGVSGADEEETETEGTVGRVASHLKRAEGCQDLLSEIQADAIAKLEAQAAAKKGRRAHLQGALR